MANTHAPRNVVDSSLHQPTSQVKSQLETQRSVILDPKDDYLVLDDIKVGTWFYRTVLLFAWLYSEDCGQRLVAAKK